MMDKGSARFKKERLIDCLGKLDSLLVAFSGGIDSAFLLAAAREALGGKVVAAHILFQTNEIEIPEFIANGIDRCYHCKAALSGKLLQMARERGTAHVAHGANVDDLEDYRPGLRAAQEAGIMAPLIDAHLTKEEIRFLAKEMGLSEWNKPAMACLASRFPYGCPITEKGLGMVESAEEFFLDEGFSGVRVRHHGPVARIEVDASEINRLVNEERRKAIVERLRKIGFEHIALDLEGYVSGKMNRGIETDNPFGIDG
jgi:uncharacterized protein